MLGGDFFDVFTLGDDRWGLVLGDVSGKGAEAAAITALARYTLRTLASARHWPSRTLRELNTRLLAATDVERSRGDTTAAATTRRFGLGYALRALSRDRATVAVHLLGHEAAIVGTIDGVGADHLDLAEHPEGTARRRENVTAVTTVATSALLLVESRR